MATVSRSQMESMVALARPEAGTAGEYRGLRYSSLHAQLSPDHRLDVELSEAEAQKLLAQLRQEKPGILNWLLEGRRQALSRMGVL